MFYVASGGAPIFGRRAIPGPVGDCMKTNTRTTFVRSALTVLVTLIALAACNNPFQVGLGDNVDIDRPEGDVSSPDAGNYLRGVATLTGIHSDDTTAIPSVALSFDSGASSVPATVDEDGWTYDLDTTTRPDGELEVLITITDNSRKSVEKRRLYYVDNTPPLVLVKNPQAYLTNSYNGDVTVRGETADLFAIDLVRVQILDDLGEPLSGLDTADGTNSWVFTFDSRMYADPAGDLQISVVATDRAGNVSTSLLHYDDVLNGNGGQPITVEDLRRLSSGESVAGTTITEPDIELISMAKVPVSIDNDLDKPTVSIASPQNGQSVGGAVLVAGTAIDDDGLDRVEMRLDLNGDGDYDDQFDLNDDGDPNDPFEKESEWVTLSGTVLWTQDLNADGELYEVEPGHNGQVRIQTRAVDINGLVGNPVEIAIRFDDKIPRIEGLEVDGRVFFSGISVSGTVELTGSIRDDEQVDRVRISYDGGVSYTDIFNRNGSFNDGSIAVNGANDLTLSKTIDTTNVPGGLGALYVRLLVFDNNLPTPYQVLSYVTLNVDNDFPEATWDTGEADPQDIAGSSARVQGTASDEGTIGGVEEIHVYFVLSGQVYDLSADNTTADTETADFYDGVVGVDPGTDRSNVKSFPYTPDNGADNNPPYYRIEIDNRIELGDDTGGNGDDDGFDESLTLSGNEYTWWADFDSSRIPDGAVDIHYVVFDTAGNGTHYKVDGFVKNDSPRLESVVLGTDLNEDGDTMDAGERTSPEIEASSLPATGFTAINDVLYVELTPVAGTGNGAITYSLVELGQPGVELIASGNAALIDTTGYTPDGLYTFRATLEDSVGIITSYDLQVTIDNIDGSDPTMTFDPLAQTSIKGYGSTPEGHFDDDTTAPMDAEPDLSGTFVLSGSAHDNQRIQTIELQIDGYDAGAGYGNPATVASWNGTTLVATAPFSITDQELDQATGHSIEWQYEWNTSDIQNVAAADVAVTLTATDASVRTNSAGDVVDVMPYVTGIDSYLSGALGSTLARSSTGAFPVRSGETVTVRGYNLNPAVVDDVRLSIDPDAIDTGILQGEPITFANVAADYTSVDVTLTASGSGYLTVFTNGVPSTNSVNDNGLAHNTVSSGTHVTLSDDLYVSLWEQTDLGQTVALAANALYPSMALDGDVPAFAYVNNSEGYGQARYLHGTTDRNIYRNWDLFTYTGIGFNASGDHAVLYDINVVNGNNGDYNSGNYGGILTSFFYDVPNHDWSPGAYFFWDNSIWLDNLVDSVAPQTTAVLDRYQFPDLEIVGTTAESNVFYSTYDRLENRIIFRTYRVGTDATIDDTSGGRINDQGTALYTDIPQYNQNGVMPPYDGQNWGDNQRFINSNTAGKSPEAGDGAAVTVFTPATSFGSHTAVAATADGSVATLVYYDESGTGSLQYVYNETPRNAGTWSIPLTLATSAGFEYMDMEIDSAGVVHIAYYDAYGGDVHYVQLPSYGAGTFINTVVDSYLVVGDKLSLALDSSNVPHLTYKGIGNTARAARLLAGSAADGVDGSDRYNGNWDIQSLPGSVADSDANRFGIGVRTSDSQPVVGYTDGGLEYQRLLAPLTD